uniref:AB hydrolase-1 domain-containing protein n=1 Tax=Kalanchoe fedtschenkoi TaxID=63787 RepID=A0A7N0UKS9_KALFE
MGESSFRRGEDDGGVKVGSGTGAAVGGRGGGEVGVRDVVVEFGKAVGELVVEFGKGVRDIVKQTLVSEDSFVVRKVRPQVERVGRRLRFLNEYLPEDRDPRNSWLVILCVSVLAIAVLSVNNRSGNYAPLPKKVSIHPPTASLVLLPDGRHLAYEEQGVPADRARFTLFCQHSFLSSRLAGIPGIKSAILTEFGVRLVSYDLPGFGESDPHPSRNLESSALDIALLANALNVNEKFWVIGVSGGSMHTWAALRYLPDRVAGAAMFAPFVNPYDSSMTKEERHATWSKWTSRRKFLYFLARKFPKFLAYFYGRSFLSGNHGQIDKLLSLSVGRKDKAVIESSWFREFWERDVEESLRQGRVEPFIEEAALQVSNWGFRISDLKMQKKQHWKGIIHWLKSAYCQEEDELTGFLGPIHIWQGMEDRIVPPSMTEFVARTLPEVIVHKLPCDGHFTYFYFCDKCHRQAFITLFGIPKGPLDTSTSKEADLSAASADEEVQIVDDYKNTETKATIDLNSDHDS